MFTPIFAKKTQSDTILVEVQIIYQTEFGCSVCCMYRPGYFVFGVFEDISVPRPSLSLSSQVVSRSGPGHPV